MNTTNLHGFHYAITGFKSLLLPKIRSYIIWPIIINFIIFGLLFGFGMHYLWHKFTFHITSLPHWLEWFNTLLFSLKLALITFIATFFLGIFTILATISANLIGAPFNGLLSEALSKKMAHAELPDQHISQMLMSTFKREFIKFFYYLPRMIGIFVVAGICYFIPVLNLLSPILLYGFSAWMMAIQYLDYPADNHQLSFPEFLKSLKKEKGLCLTFGLAISLLSSIPFANFIVMPAAVLGATRLWHDKFFVARHSTSPDDTNNPAKKQRFS